MDNCKRDICMPDIHKMLGLVGPTAYYISWKNPMCLCLQLSKWVPILGKIAASHILLIQSDNPCFFAFLGNCFYQPLFSSWYSCYQSPILCKTCDQEKNLLLYRRILLPEAPNCFPAVVCRPKTLQLEVPMVLSFNMQVINPKTVFKSQSYPQEFAAASIHRYTMALKR